MSLIAVLMLADDRLHAIDPSQMLGAQYGLDPAAGYRDALVEQ